MSRPSRARGLKQHFVGLEKVTAKSRPSRARGLKPASHHLHHLRYWSRPSRARGLKQTVQSSNGSQSESRPSRARGLKLNPMVWRRYRLDVAPLAGAWVETRIYPRTILPHSSRPSRARGLKLKGHGAVRGRHASRPSRARGLKHLARREALVHPVSRPSRARGLKHHQAALVHRHAGVAPLAGAWVETAPTHWAPQASPGRAPRGRVG